MSKIKINNYLITLLLILLSVATLSAHPHEFAKVKLNVTIKNSTITKIQTQWHFDEMTSELIKTDFDMDMDGKFDKNEVRNLKENGFDVLKEIDYYAILLINGKKEKIAENNISQFNVEIKNDIVIYSFNIIKKITLKKYDKIKITYSDDEFYTAFIMENKDISLTGEKDKIKFEVAEEETELYYSDVLNIEVIK